MGRVLVSIFIFVIASILLSIQLALNSDDSSILGARLRKTFSLQNEKIQQVIIGPSNDRYQEEEEYLLGVGKADITGPVVEINFMGYADTKQTGTGLRQRLYSRAFIIGSLTEPSERIVYLVLDTQSGDTAVRHGILEGLENMGPSYAVYGRQNVAVTGTHSHSGPGAWLNYLLPQITSKGFDKQSYEAIVKGALLSIRRAHESLEAGNLEFSTTHLEDANINRSLYAYLANPSEERKRYSSSVDKTMSLLKFTRSSDQTQIGVLTWFPVHGTSMQNNNTLVTGDNKGVAAYLVEKKLKENRSLRISDNFVAGFSQSNVGDTSPNVLGAFCEDGSGEECSFKASLCSGKNQPCHGRGPYFGLDDSGTRSCYEIGSRQANAVLTSYRIGTTVPISGAIRSLHTYKDFSNFKFMLSNGSSARTCPAALGYSFAAGTSDGPGAFDFKQNNPGDPKANPLWSVVRRLIREPSENQTQCHTPKPILLDVGELSTPYPWTPNIVDIQLLRVGQLSIIVSPGEATTMAGRRWRQAIETSAREILGIKSPLVVLGGPSNTYTHYITTEEEYGVQRYEGASTLYGAHTLNAYINVTSTLLGYLSADQSKVRKPLELGPDPPININNSLSFISPVLYDTSGFFSSFGDVSSDAQSPKEHIYTVGETVTARFVGANPRNNLRLEETYASVEKQRSGVPTFDVVRDDADWDLVFQWRRVNEIAGTSEVTVSWEIPTDAAAGIYRIVYYGDSKAFGSGTITSFVGRSGEFEVGKTAAET